MDKKRWVLSQALLIAGGLIDSKSFVVPLWVILGAAANCTRNFLRWMENRENDGIPVNEPATLPRILRRNRRWSNPGIYGLAWDSC